MLTQEQAVEIKVLARRGTAVREIARQTGLSRNTVRRYLRDEQAARYKQREPRPTKLDPFKDYLLERVAAARPHWIPATVLIRELQEAGYEGGISQLKAFLAPYKRAEPEPVVRFETPPGKQMQADFTVIRRGRAPLLALVATLGYSRASFVRFTAGEDAATLCECCVCAGVRFNTACEYQEIVLHLRIWRASTAATMLSRRSKRRLNRTHRACSRFQGSRTAAMMVFLRSVFRSWRMSHGSG
jgi:transposase